MGRPIKSKFFGNRNPQGTGGEGFATVAVLTTGTLYSTTTNYTWTSSAPQLAGGAAASGTLTIAANRGVSAFNVVSAGSGFTSTSSVTVTVSPATTGSAATYAITLTSGASARQNAIKFQAWVGATGQNRTSGNDIVEQRASHRYLVKTQDGTEIAKLVARTPAARGEMAITATDSNSNAYWVTKLTAKLAVVTRKVSGSGNFASGSKVPWTTSKGQDFATTGATLVYLETN